MKMSSEAPTQMGPIPMGPMARFGAPFDLTQEVSSSSLPSCMYMSMRAHLCVWMLPPVVLKASNSRHLRTWSMEMEVAGCSLRAMYHSVVLFKEIRGTVLCSVLLIFV
jgi:hypothetical protein